MTIIGKFVAAGLIVCTAHTTGFSGTRTVEGDKRRSVIIYHVDHFFHSVDGVCKEVTCNVVVDSASDAILSVFISAPVTAFNSGNSSRDTTAMRAIESTKYPLVEFVSDTVRCTSDSTMMVSGKLDFHGVKRKISINVTETANLHSTVFDGEFHAAFSDFNIERPSLVFIPISDSFGVKFHVVLDQRI